MKGDILDEIEELEEKIKKEKDKYFNMCARHESSVRLKAKEKEIAQLQVKLDGLKSQLTSGTEARRG